MNFKIKTKVSFWALSGCQTEEHVEINHCDMQETMTSNGLKEELQVNS